MGCRIQSAPSADARRHPLWSPFGPDRSSRTTSPTWSFNFVPSVPPEGEASCASSWLRLLGFQPHLSPPEGCFQSEFPPSVTMSVRQCSSARRRHRVLGHPKMTSQSNSSGSLDHPKVASLARPQSRGTSCSHRFHHPKVASSMRAFCPGWWCFPRPPRQPEGCFVDRLPRHRGELRPASATHPKTSFVGRLLPTQAVRLQSVPSTRKPTLFSGHALPMSWLGRRIPCPTRRSNSVSDSRPHSVGLAMSTASPHPKAR